jgi:hypothetical protein
VSGPDELFDSYLNMDELRGVMDQEMSEVVLPGGGGDEAEERVVENEVTFPNGLGASTRESLSTSGSDESSTKNTNGDGGLDLQTLEEGEVDSSEAPVPSTRSPETPESGEIRSQESSSIVPLGVSSQSVVPGLAPTPTLVHLTSSASVSLSPSSGSPRSTMSAKSASQPLGCAGTLVIPDISSYKGVRFKRPLPEARENSFFSRALNGAARPVKAPASVEESIEQRGREGDGSTSCGVSMPAEVPPSVGEVQDQDEDADMQDNTAFSMHEPLMASPEAVVPTPLPVPQQPAEAPMVPEAQSTSSTALVQPSTVEPSTTANDSLLASTQPITPSIRATPSQPPAATQPLASRPFIAPPRVPRPSEPMSLVSVLNEMRRERLQARKEELELARKRSVVDLTGASSHLHRSPLDFIASHVRMQPSPPFLPRALAKVRTRHPHPHNSQRRRRLLRNRRERLGERRV